MKSQLHFELYVAHSYNQRLPVRELVRARVELDGESYAVCEGVGRGRLVVCDSGLAGDVCTLRLAEHVEEVDLG